MGYIYDKAEYCLRLPSDTTRLSVIPGAWALVSYERIPSESDGQPVEQESIEKWSLVDGLSPWGRHWGGHDRLTFYIQKALVDRNEVEEDEDDDRDDLPNPAKEFASEGREHPNLEFTAWKVLPTRG